MVIGVAVGDHERTEISHADIEHVEVAGQAVGCKAGVIQRGAPLTFALDGDQRRESVLGDQLWRSPRSYGTYLRTSSAGATRSTKLSITIVTSARTTGLSLTSESPASCTSLIIVRARLGAPSGKPAVDPARHPRIPLPHARRLSLSRRLAAIGAVASRGATRQLPCGLDERQRSGGDAADFRILKRMREPPRCPSVPLGLVRGGSPVGVDRDACLFPGAVSSRLD